jgi:hypothetical protein
MKRLHQIALGIAALAAGFFADPATASMLAVIPLATRRASPAKKKGISVDFTGVESGGRHVPEGDYLLEVAEVETKQGKESGEDYLSFTFEIVEGDAKGTKVYHNCSLQPQALFNLRGLLEALGVDIPEKGAMDLDPEELVGMKCGASLQTETYEGKKKSRPVEFFPESELVDDEAAGKKDKKDEEPAGKTKKKTVKKPTFEVGDKVKFTDDENEEQSGKVTKIEDDTATVKVGKDEWEISLDELEAA